ncbi:MAG: DUF4956 domain-containing protein [Algibacter sp.]
MNELTNLIDIELNTVNTFDFIIGFIITLVLSFIIKYSYNKYALSVSNKTLTSSLFPFFSIAIFVIVVTIKSSLVLSLGLVGALSIIRFRTAIKEPEQLVYYLMLTAVSISTAAEGFIFGFSLVAFVFTYSIYRKRKYTSNAITQNDQIVLKFDSLTPSQLESLIKTLINLNCDVTIQNYNIKTDTTILVLKVSGINLEVLSTFEKSIRQIENTNLLDLQLINSID